MSLFSDVPRDQWLAYNDHAYAIRDSFPVSPGHTLIVTRRIVATWWEATRAEQVAILDLIDQVKRQLDDEFAAPGYNVGFNAGEAAGQTIHHLHVHVIPRYRGDVPDPRGGVRHVIPRLANYLAPRLEPADNTPPALMTPLGGRLYLELTRCLLNDTLDRIDLLVSFVMRSGIDVLAEWVDRALDRGAHIRLLTTDYLQVTDVSALGFFLDRLGVHPSGGRLEAKVFQDPSTSFHPKAYMFWRSGDRTGSAIVGSSNLSLSGLKRGVEWNIETRNLPALIEEFETLWADRRAQHLTASWLSAYELHKAALGDRRVEHLGVLVGDEEPEAKIEPWSVQAEALSALVATRVEGHHAGMVVMATGLGKTWLAAFDSTRPEFKRVLFIAHREEILTQARDIYRRIRPGGTYSMFMGGEHDPSGGVVFATVQTLHRHVDTFATDTFDYVVVDEFHHASAPTYRSVIGYFRPRFLLGLTATPERSDAADLMALCGDNLVYDCGLVEGVRRELLSSFRYRAIADVADYAEIPWRSGRFDVEALAERLETQQRAEQIFIEWSVLNGPQRRSLAFCCSISHAEFMAQYFAERGVAAVAVHSGPSSTNRSEALTKLDVGAVQVVFTVDLFNEGVDVPSIDLVLMLRPTESPVVFFQQLGRGLRRAEGKTHLDVIDLVGNHKSFLLKARLLAKLAGRGDTSDRKALEVLQQPLTDLPDGCSVIVDLEAINLLERLIGAPSKADQIAVAVQQWQDEHGGSRPTALELSVALDNDLKIAKKAGGWFGLLRSIGALTDGEQAVFEFAQAFFAYIETGSYSKSYKLVTMRAMLDMGTLRGRSPMRELALAARWQMFSDPRLLADLDDAGSSFVDVWNPTEAEWLRYWRKNPINALIGGNAKGVAPWFVATDDAVDFVLSVPDALGSTFDAMVREMVEYRLHRYLVGQATKRSGERRKPVGPDGQELDATFEVEGVLGQATSVVIHSQGGGRNASYKEGMGLLLERLQLCGATLLDTFVDSREVRKLALPDRRIRLGYPHDFPLRLAEVGELGVLRDSLQRAMKRIGQPEGVKGGNGTRAIRLVFELATPRSTISVADYLQSGEWRGAPLETRAGGLGKSPSS